MMMSSSAAVITGDITFMGIRSDTVGLMAEASVAAASVAVGSMEVADAAEGIGRLLTK
jgi:hypothetical protein